MKKWIAGIVALFVVLLLVGLWPLIAYWLIVKIEYWDSYKERIDRPFTVSAQWQTIVFDDPFRIDREARQYVHLGIDRKLYDDDLGYTMSKNLKSDVQQKLPRFIDIRRRSDEKLIVPDIELLAEDGTAVKVRARESLSWYNGDYSIGYGTYAEWYWEKPPNYPDHLREFTSMRIRSDDPFDVQFIVWRK
jgi:hypothetical protein